MKKNWKSKLSALALTAALALGLLTGCGAGAPTAPTAAPGGEPAAAGSVAAAGSLLLSVNPEIEIEYDHKGLVLELEGLNQDGKDILLSAEDYLGHPAPEVARELVARINEAGYFDTTVGGHERNIVLKLERGSQAPEGFLESVAQEIRTLVTELGIGSTTALLDQDDYDGHYENYISEQAAKALLETQLQREDIHFLEKDYDLDDGTYELEFILDGVAYEYEVDAVTGKVYEMDRDADDNDDHNDDRDDDDDRFDDDRDDDDRFDDNDRDDGQDDDDQDDDQDNGQDDDQDDDWDN